MRQNIETQKIEVLPSIEEIGEKLSELFKIKENRDMFSGSLLSLIEFAKASQKKTISLGARDAIKKMYDLIKK